MGRVFLYFDFRLEGLQNQKGVAVSRTYILKDHEPVQVDDLVEWGRWFEVANRRVGVDKVGSDVEVSTVFLGLDHNFCGGPPLLFETMIFGGPLDGEQERYSTWEEAENGHKAMVEKASRAKQSSGSE
jgi:hypothetical protein